MKEGEPYQAGNVNIPTNWSALANAAVKNLVAVAFYVQATGLQYCKNLNWPQAPHNERLLKQDCIIQEIHQ